MQTLLASEFDQQLFAPSPLIKDLQKNIYNMNYLFMSVQTTLYFYFCYYVAAKKEANCFHV